MNKEQRNEKQRARRASPEAKAKEAQASRRSYWKKMEGIGASHLSTGCSVCREMNEKHDLGLVCE